MALKRNPVLHPPLRAASIASKIAPLLALAIFGTLFARHLLALDGGAVLEAFHKISALQWALAGLCTAASFRAIGVYDVLVHRVLRTGQNPATARRAGMLAIAISQTVGFGAVSGALVRWRCLPDLGGFAVARLSAVVSLSFLAALAAVSAIVLPLSGLLPSSASVIAGGLAALVGLLTLGRIAHKLGWIAAPLSVPTLVSLLIATAVDTAFAAAALFILWPEPISFQLLFAAYLVALGAGLVSNSPGGLGAFDLTLLALVPVTAAAPATCALLAFRLIYYIVPAAIALALLVRSTRQPPPRALHHPEATLAQQDAHLTPLKNGTLLTLPCWGNGAAYGPLPPNITIADFTAPAAPEALYKCSAAEAVMARTAGWSVLRCAKDALIAPQDWTTAGSEKRQLRRALKSFAASGLRIDRTTDNAALAPVAAAWAISHGGERGLSMGRYDPEYLRRQLVFAAYDGVIPQAFISLHLSPDRWTLDLVRHVDDIPNGVMHALIVAAIEAARDAHIPVLSLACVPAPEPHLPLATASLKTARGLTRFKSSFAPQWQPRYICAKGPMRLCLTMLSLAWRIHYPPALGNQPHDDHEDFSVEPLSRACEAQVTP